MLALGGGQLHVDTPPVTMGRMPTLLGPTAARPGTARAGRSGHGRGPVSAPHHGGPSTRGPVGQPRLTRLGPGPCRAWLGAPDARCRPGPAAVGCVVTVVCVLAEPPGRLC